MDTASSSLAESHTAPYSDTLAFSIPSAIADGGAAVALPIKEHPSWLSLKMEVSLRALCLAIIKETLECDQEENATLWESTDRGMRLAQPTLRIVDMAPSNGDFSDHLVLDDPALEGLVARSSIRTMSNSIGRFEQDYPRLLRNCQALKLSLGKAQAKDEKVAEDLLLRIFEGHSTAASQASCALILSARFNSSLTHAQSAASQIAAALRLRTSTLQ
jgi:hypothetical protein